MIEFRILGPVEAWRGGASLNLTGAKVHTVLAALLLGRSRFVADEHLVSMLWGDSPPSTPNAQIYNYASRIRKYMKEDVALSRRDSGYILGLGESTLDYFIYEDLVVRAKSALQKGRTEEASVSLGRALDLWRGNPLGNVSEHLSSAECPSINEMHQTTTELWVQTELALGRHRQALPRITDLVSKHPLREGLRVDLMTALHRCDRQADALAVFHEARTILGNELGIDPGPALIAAYQRVLDNTTESPNDPAAQINRSNRIQWAPIGIEPIDIDGKSTDVLPPDIADFTGRQTEVDRLTSQLLAERTRESEWRPRRILITGSPGSGKTALAVHVAHQLSESFPDGVLFTKASDTGHPMSVTERLTKLLAALGEADIPPNASVLQLQRQYRHACSGRSLLIFIDDVPDDDHLQAVLPTVPTAHVVVTSRRHLSTINSELTLILGQLPRNQAISLVSTVAGPNRIDPSDPAISELIDQCDRNPLALRAAALRLASRPSWSVRFLVDRLSDPRGRLDELTIGEHSVRHTLESALLDIPSELHAPLLADVGAESLFTADDLNSTLRKRSDKPIETILERLVDLHVLWAHGTDDYGRITYRTPQLMRIAAQNIALSAV
ncbi:BTAD domain-containing putative transcriptional regulator [Rhodococcus sp. IEGM 1381]|uniref:AfsR/SARP family transcriptional regulator n=1 Tax=Rhodococcus sp. IEGM 1381 TaxID=3047085 RepID=UPI0024B86554|nr:BTAD domain-containing putative transcriptional regulator [Rhodococcus sp. IEGM 1381]MDI9894485.1 BTAD domain-containing putative transcriptional regulator [Rhodococcus sp. IEGM 1381]